MSKEEDKLDKFLKDIITDSGFETPPSDDYTQKVMLKVAALPVSQFRKVRFSNQLAIALIGVEVWAMLGIAAYFLWQIGWIGDVIVLVSNLLDSLFDIFSMKTISIIIIGLILHTIIFRGLLAIYLLKKKSQIRISV